MFCKRIVEELLVGTPPERIVDHVRPSDSRIFQHCTVKWHILRDAVDEHRISGLPCLEHLVDVRELSMYAIRRDLVHTLNERVGE